MVDRRFVFIVTVVFSFLANTHQTLRKPWAETVECSYRKEHVVTDLVALKGYLRAGTTVTVMEEKVNALHGLVSGDQVRLGREGAVLTCELQCQCPFFVCVNKSPLLEDGFLCWSQAKYCSMRTRLLCLNRCFPGLLLHLRLKMQARRGRQRRANRRTVPR